MTDSYFIPEDLAEGHPAHLSDQEQLIDMAAILPAARKMEAIPFLRSNFGKMSQREMARRLKVGKTSVNRWTSEIGLMYAKHAVNEHFFDEWSAQMAYVLGYVFADGNVSWNPRKGYQSLTITASEKDKQHLEKIRNILSSTKPLLYAERTSSYRLIANGKNLCIRLMTLGVTPHKSLTVRFPEVPRKYLKHFIRGVIDGDGTVRYVHRPRSPYFEISISSGSRRFLAKLVMAIKNEIGIDSRVRKVQGNTFITQYSCRRGLKLADWVYDGSNLCLERKRQQHRIALQIRQGGEACA